MLCYPVPTLAWNFVTTQMPPTSCPSYPDARLLCYPLHRRAKPESGAWHEKNLRQVATAPSPRKGMVTSYPSSVLLGATPCPRDPPEQRYRRLAPPRRALALRARLPEPGGSGAAAYSMRG
jgi:hypothetical protein